MTDLLCLVTVAKKIGRLLFRGLLESSKLQMLNVLELDLLSLDDAVSIGRCLVEVSPEWGRR